MTGDVSIDPLTMCNVKQFGDELFGPVQRVHNRRSVEKMCVLKNFKSGGDHALHEIIQSNKILPLCQSPQIAK
jgi:hypothetical protein